MVPGDEALDLQERLEEAERRLHAIGELAVSQVAIVGTPEQKLVDAELRLNRIQILATKV